MILVAFDYLNQPANGIHRTGAIAVGAISGYIIAIRRGFFRRLIYTSVGGLGVASICYPKEAELYWHQALHGGKTYATILYNFAYGGKLFTYSIQKHYSYQQNIFYIYILIFPKSVKLSNLENTYEQLV